MGSLFKEFFDKGKSNDSNAEVIYTNDPLEGTSTQKFRATISGRVQGVGFRFTTKQAADELGVGGIVRNESDGTVYVEAVGDAQNLSRFIEALKKGPSPSSDVDKVVITYDENIEEKTNFSQAN
ncbi:MAG: acylphosphatase [Alkalibacterium sp.]|nr:acylphosphatase [Alkalibacterium sp.]